MSVQLPSPWILSPIKGSNKAAPAEPHFLEMTFSEDEEDEEYKPSEDELKVRGHALVALSVMSDSPAVIFGKTIQNVWHFAHLLNCLVSLQW